MQKGGARRIVLTYAVHCAHVCGREHVLNLAVSEAQTSRLAELLAPSLAASCTLGSIARRLCRSPRQPVPIADGIADGQTSGARPGLGPENHHGPAMPRPRPSPRRPEVAARGTAAHPTRLPPATCAEHLHRARNLGYAERHHSLHCARNVGNAERHHSNGPWLHGLSSVYDPLHRTAGARLRYRTNSASYRPPTPAHPARQRRPANRPPTPAPWPSRSTCPAGLRHWSPAPWPSPSTCPTGLLQQRS